MKSSKFYIGRIDRDGIISKFYIGRIDRDGIITD